MNPRSLHPNLARLRLNWEMIYDSQRRGDISAQEAARRMNSLRAPDDQGVMWMYGVDRTWYFVDSTGQFRPGSPPTHGIPGPTPEDLSAPLDPTPREPMAHTYPHGTPRYGPAGQPTPSPIETPPANSTRWLTVVGVGLAAYLLLQLLG